MYQKNSNCRRYGVPDTLSRLQLCQNGVGCGSWHDLDHEAPHGLARAGLDIGEDVAGRPAQEREGGAGVVVLQHTDVVVPGRDAGGLRLLELYVSIRTQNGVLEELEI